MGRLPPLEYRETEDRIGYAVDVLVPGFVEASAAHQAGYPIVPGTRLPTYATWIWEYVDRPDDMGYEPGFMTREKIIAAYAFEAGVEWQRSRSRRRRMHDAENDHHRQYRSHRERPA